MFTEGRVGILSKPHPSLSTLPSADGRQGQNLQSRTTTSHHLFRSTPNNSTSADTCPVALQTHAKRSSTPFEFSWKSTKLPRHHLLKWNCQILARRPPRAVVLLRTRLLCKLPGSRGSATGDTEAERLPLGRLGGKTAVESPSIRCSSMHAARPGTNLSETGLFS